MSKGQDDWKSKFSDLVQTCQSELKKTTQIGMKMLSASQSNTALKETYEKIGLLVKELSDKEELEIKDERVIALFEEVSQIEDALKQFESEVQSIKKS